MHHVYVAKKVYIDIIKFWVCMYAKWKKKHVIVIPTTENWHMENKDI